MSQRRQPHGRKSRGNTLELLLEFHTLFRVSINYLGSVFPFKNTTIGRALNRLLRQLLRGVIPF